MTRFQRLAEIFTIGLLLTMAVVGHCAESSTPADQPRISQLNPGDPLSLQVIGQPDVISVAVSDDGTINVPLAGSIHVAGLSPTDAAARVAKALKDGGYYVDPRVTIAAQPRSQLVSVLGEVHTTGRFPITPGMTILDLLAQAGGLKETAADTGYVQRQDDSGHSNRYPVKLSGLADIKGTLPIQTLLGGDSLIVPAAEQFYVTGEVRTPGKYPIGPDMTVMKAILQAGGITERGSDWRIEVRRMDKNGQYKVVHAKPGDPVQADDIIRVKESIF